MAGSRCSNCSSQSLRGCFRLCWLCSEAGSLRVVARRPIGSSRLKLQLLSKPTGQGLLSPRGARKSHREALIGQAWVSCRPLNHALGRADWLAVVHKIIWPPVGQGQHYQNLWTEREGGVVLTRRWGATLRGPISAPPATSKAVLPEAQKGPLSGKLD